MYGKVQITGTLEVMTGMHIGGSKAFAAIGAVDAPVVRDIRTNHPYIPGSTLKGKMRALLAKEYNEIVVSNPDNDNIRISRLFGSSKGKIRSRLLFSDMFICNEDELKEYGFQMFTEVKFENSIKRTTAEANPRQIERIIRGSRFALDLMYSMDKEDKEYEFIEDMETLAEGLRLLQYDYLGGHGTRGYGKIKLFDLGADAVAGDIPQEMVDQCRDILRRI